MREAGSTLAADMWPREVKVGGVGSSAGRGLFALARRLGFEGATESTATQQGAAPDRPQCCRFSGFSALLVVGRDWRAAGELSVLSRRAALLCAILFEGDKNGRKCISNIGKQGGGV